MELETFRKLPLGGVDRRSLVGLMKEKGASAAQEALQKQLPSIEKQGVTLPDDSVVLILGGSNGITRALALQLVFGEGVAVMGVHYDSAKMQIGVHHAAAMMEAAEKAGRYCQLLNRDATRDKTIDEVIGMLKDRFRCVHVLNGIAAGATKRYEKHGTTEVLDLDVAFDPLMQVPDFGNREAYRRLGKVEVEVASAAEIERTNKFMGSSSYLWAKPLAEAGLLIRGESSVSFCDYDFEKDDPVYGMGPLAGAKILQREMMDRITNEFGVRALRLCYPAMPTTALGAIPGGMLMYALSAQILRERGAYQTIPELARASMAGWQEPLPAAELRLDDAYQAALPEFHKRKDALTPDAIPDALSKLFQ